MPNHGGKRQRAGRPSKNRRLTNKAVELWLETYEMVMEIKDKTKESISEIIHKAIKNYK